MSNATQSSALIHWHRRMGLIAAALIIVLAISGLALNHTNALGLDKHKLTTPWLLDWYGIETAGKMRGYPAGAHWLMTLENRLFLNAQILPHTLEDVIGVVVLEGVILVAARTEILLLDGDGALIERISAIPSPIARIGVTPQGRAAIAVIPDRIFTADTALLEWRQTSDTGIDWSTERDVPAALQDKILVNFRGDGLSAERILLDVHSGRILGRFGPWVMDGAAIFLLLLAATGIIGWMRGRKNGTRNGA